ncbi:hypothetical protein [Gemmiger formicilis]|uniref:hypothetical protein n=1 Tax=Gemmiger formicilis TaxID=745368 RepID=UPI00399451DF
MPPASYTAYRKDNYDNLTLKYDFTAEGQAIANMFESSTDTVNAYNATLDRRRRLCQRQGQRLDAHGSTR